MSNLRLKKRYENASKCRFDGCKNLCFIADYCSEHRYCISVKKRYNISWEEKKAMWLAQECKCLICGKLQTLREICVDHYNDKNGKPIVRGLLCKNCNTGIGLLNHNTQILHSAVTYLEGKKHTTSLNYSAAELIDRLTICQLKVWHLSEQLERQDLKDDEYKVYQKQIDTQNNLIEKISMVLQFKFDSNVGQQVAKVSHDNISIWHCEEQMADSNILDEVKAKVQDNIIKTNTHRMSIIKDINKTLEEYSNG
jgi:hypothetical protein